MIISGSDLVIIICRSITFTMYAVPQGIRVQFNQLLKNACQQIGANKRSSVMKISGKIKLREINGLMQLSNVSSFCVKCLATQGMLTGRYGISNNLAGTGLKKKKLFYCFRKR